MSAAPYPGLRPFRRREVDVFFGREAQVDRLLEKLAARRFLAVVGISGCGKSSLVRAGMVPALETGFLASAGARWRVATMRPGERPLERLAAALVAGPLRAERAGQAGAEAFVHATLRRGPLGLVEVLGDTPLPAATNLLLVVDQFEEIFRYRSHGDLDQADAFVALLLASAAAAELPLYVAITMRSDFLGDCALFRGLPEAMNDSQYLTPRLTRDELRSAIVGPAGVFGATVEPALVNRLLNDTGADPDQLPLLQHLLMRMWTRAGERSEGVGAGPIALGLADYHAVGGFGDALSRHADEAFAALDGEGQRIAELTFRCLGERGAGRDTRRPARLREVAAVAGVGAARVMPVVEAFRRADRCFLTPPAQVALDAQSVLDISHESLIRQWRRLSRWVEAEAESAKVYRRLVQTARLWRAGQAGLWGSPDLELARRLADASPPAPVWAAWAERYGGDAELATAFLAASEAKREDDRRRARQARQARETQRRIRRRNLILSAGLALTLALALLAVTGWQRAARFGRLARAGLLVSQAARTVDDAPQRALLLAAEALAATPAAGPLGRRAREVLLHALSRTGGRALGHDDEVMAVAISADGRWLASAGKDRQVRLWRLDRPPAPPVILGGHQDAVTVVAISPDGSWLATGSDDHTARVWRLEEPTAPPAVLRAHRDSLSALAISPDSRWLVTGSEDRTVLCWDLHDAAAAPLAVGRHDDVVSALAFNPRGDRLLSASDDNSAQLFVFADGAVGPGRLLYGHGGPIRAAAFGPRGDWLVTASEDNTARLWLLGEAAVDADGRPAAPASLILVGHHSSVVAVAWSADGRLLATASHDRTARLWDLEALAAGEPPAIAVLRGHQSPLSDLALSADGRWLVTASWDQTARLWRLAPAVEPVRVLYGHDQRINALAISPDSAWLATASRDRSVRLWSLTTVDRAATPSLALLGHRDGVLDLEADPGGRFLATASADNSARVWDLQAADVASTAVPLRGHTSSLHDVDWSADGAWLATASGDGTVRLWRSGVPFDGDQTPRVLRGHGSLVLDLAFDPTSRVLASASRDATILLWDLDAAGEPSTLAAHTDAVTAVAFSPDGATLASGSEDDTVRLWSPQRPDQPPAVLAGHRDAVTRLAFDPGGRYLASGSEDGTVRLWPPAAEDGRQAAWVLAGHRGPVTALAFAPRGRFLVSAGEGTARVWDLEQGDPTAAPIQLTGHLGAVTAAAFSSDGRTLATTTESGMVRLWQLAADGRAATLLGDLGDHRGAVTSAAFVAGRDLLVTGSKDQTARLWHVELWRQPRQALIDLACRRAGRRLSAAERAEYLPGGEQQRDACARVPAAAIAAAAADDD